MTTFIPLILHEYSMQLIVMLELFPLVYGIDIILPLANLHKRDHWLRMASALNDSNSLDKTTQCCKIAHSTAFRWRHIFHSASFSEMSDTPDGNVEAVETYLPRSHK